MLVQDILNGFTVLQKINEQEFNIKTTLKIVKNISVLNEVLNIFNDKRKALVGDEEVESMSKDELRDINAKIEAYALEEVEVEISKLSLDELEDLKLSGAQYSQVSWMIDA